MKYCVKEECILLYVFFNKVGMSMNPRALGRKKGGGSISHVFLAINPQAPGLFAQ